MNMADVTRRRDESAAACERIMGRKLTPGELADVTLAVIRIMKFEETLCTGKK